MPVDHELATYYARRAKEYDRVYDKPERQFELAVLKSRVTALLAGRHLYEVACGTGYWSAVLAPGAASLLATDYNEEVLEIARSRGLSATGVRFARADAFSSEPLDASIDAGFAGFWWSHLRRTEIDSFLNAFFGLLGSGAHFVFIDNTYVEGSNTSIARTDAEGNTYQRRKLADGSEHEVLKNFPTDDDLCASLEPRAYTLTCERLRYYWLAHGVLR